MKIKTNIVKLLAVLAILGSLVAIAAVPAGAVATPSMALSAGNGTVGSSITISATSFPVSTILVAKFDGAAMTTSPTTVTTDSVTGAATFAVLIPTATAGLHLITVTDGVNIAPSSTTPNFKILQLVAITSPTTKSGPVGTSVTVTGTGFSGAGVTADVTMGGVPLVSGVVVDSNGSFTGTGTVPSLTSGVQTVSASDGAGNVADYFDYFTVTPTLALSPGSGLPGAVVTLTGSGWAPGSVTISFAGGSPVTVTAISSGAINDTSYQIPSSATAGVKTVAGTQGTTTASTTFTVAGRALSLSPVSGPGKTQVLLTGMSMTPNSYIDTTTTPSGLLFNGAAWAGAPANIKTDSSGTIFPTTMYVPMSLPVGTYTVQATDKGGLIAYGTFAVTQPTITLSPTTGAINSSLTITGSGWLPGTLSGSTVTITFSYTGSSGAETTTVTTVPDGNGNIAAGITVPADAMAGPATVAAQDLDNNSAVNATFTVPGAYITVTPASGAAGTTVAVTGSGFAAYTAMTVKIGTYQFLSQPLSDAMGNFNYSFTVPGLAPGSQPVTAFDGSSLASAYFVISSTGATVQAQTSGISSYLVRVWGYSGGTWYLYDPADAAGSNLATLTAGAGYWVNVNAACTLVWGSHSYALSSGWNLIGWMG